MPNGERKRLAPSLCAWKGRACECVSSMVRTNSEIPLPSPSFYSSSGLGTAAIGHRPSPPREGRGPTPLRAPSGCRLRCLRPGEVFSPPRGWSLGTVISWGVWLGRHACYNATQAS